MCILDGNIFTLLYVLKKKNLSRLQSDKSQREIISISSSQQARHKPTDSVFGQDKLNRVRKRGGEGVGEGIVVRGGRRGLRLWGWGGGGG